ncbi:MAG: S9 family peptidase [Gemmatimonadaceae bacterium]|nr:S9 family peptidase [Gemmatimonadaceae bacterium]
MTPLVFLRARQAACLLLAVAPHALHAQARPAPLTYAAIRGAPFPNELVAAAGADRIAWASNDNGRRNLFTAAGPSWAPQQLTSVTADDGQELTSVALSRDGAWAVYVRGGDHGSNWDDALPVNPVGMPLPPKVQLWSVSTRGGEPHLLGDGDAPVISPKGDVVVFEKDRHLWSVPIDGSSAAQRIVAARGTNGSATFSPDGSRLAFVSDRGDHAFIGVYADANTPIQWVAPGTSRDARPQWSPDGTRLVFMRRPGAGGAPAPMLEAQPQAWALWIGDVARGTATELWRAPFTLRGSPPSTEGGVNLHWAARDRIVFLSYVDGWPHLYSIASTGGQPLLLTPGDGMAEYITVSPDGSTVWFCGNMGRTPGDIDRRHLVRVPVDTAAPVVVTPGTGLEWTPTVTGGGTLAYIAATAQRPPQVAVRGAGEPRARLLGEAAIASYPAAQLVTPTSVTFTASDGGKVYGQLFMPAGGPARKPAVVFVHGGPPRQMLTGWHYSDYYSATYAMNQYLASRGFVVLAVNYRLGIGYGYEFHRAPHAGAQGASEYLDVKAAGEWLKARADVDGARIGIYGGSYGGYLTALALGRDSDLFAAGVDLHGVHDMTVPGSGAGTALAAALNNVQVDPAARAEAAKVAWTSSPVSSVSTWKSPVLLIHGDDDRNVRFSQTTDLVQRLTAQRVPFEELVIVDDTHHWMRHANSVRVYEAAAEFLVRTLRGAPARVP